MKEISELVGKRIRLLRESQGLSREECAHRAGIHSTFLSVLERGKKEPSLQTLDKLSKALKVPIREFIVSLDGEYPDGLSKFDLLKMVDPFLKERYTAEQAKSICEFLEQLAHS